MRGQRGFTLIEVMVVVAIIGILAGVLVLSFSKPARKVRTGGEVTAVFAAFHQAQAAYRTENSSYLSTGTDESGIYPAESDLGELAVAVTKPDEWITLNVDLPSQRLYCGYVAVTGEAGDEIPAFAADWDMEQPAGDWYVLYAKCNADGNSAVNAEYFSSSVDTTLQKKNEGR